MISSRISILANLKFVLQKLSAKGTNYWAILGCLTIFCRITQTSRRTIICGLWLFESARRLESHFRIILGTSRCFNVYQISSKIGLSARLSLLIKLFCCILGSLLPKACLWNGSDLVDTSDSRPRPWFHLKRLFELLWRCDSYWTPIFVIYTKHTIVGLQIWSTFQGSATTSYRNPRLFI